MSDFKSFPSKSNTFFISPSQPGRSRPWFSIGAGLSLALVLTALTLVGMASFSQAAVPAAPSRDVNLYRLNEKDINPPENSMLEPGGLATCVYEIDNRSDEQTVLLFTSTLPAELTFVGADPPPSGGSAMLYTWTDTLEPDEDWYVTITAQLPPTQNVLHAYFANQVSAKLTGNDTPEVNTRSAATWHYVSNAVIAKETATGWNYVANEENEAVAGEEITFTVVFTVPQGTIAYAPTPRVLLQDGLWPTGAQPAWTGDPIIDQQAIDPEAKSRTCFTQLDFAPLPPIVDTDTGPHVFSYTVYAHPRQHYFLTGDDCRTGQDTKGSRLIIQPILRWCDGPGCTVTETNAIYFADNDASNDVTIIAPEVVPTVDHVYLDADAMGQGGEQVRFDIQVRNGTGRPTAFAVELTATLDSGLTYNSHTPVGGVTGSTGGQPFVHWTVPISLPASASWDASVTAALPANFVIGTQYTVTADVSFESFEGDVVDEGVYTLIDSYVINPGLKHVKYSGPSQVTIGDTATYTVVTTLGKGALLYSPHYSDTLPLGFHYLLGTFSLEPSAALAGGPTVFDGATEAGKQDLVWHIADQDLSSASAPLVITATYQVEISGIDTDGQAVYNSSISSAVSVYNSASIYWRAIQGDPDSVVFLGMADTINNRVQVIQPYLRNDLATVRTDLPFLDKEVGDSISFNTSFANAGKSTAYDVHVCDELPTGFAYASRGSFVPSSCGALAPVSEPQAGDKGSVCFIIDAVCAGDDVQIAYTLDVLPSASPGIPTANLVSISDYSSQPGGSNDGNLDDDDLPAGVHFDRHYADFAAALPAEVDCSGGSGCPFLVRGLAGSLAADQTSVGPGDTIVYTIDYANTSGLYSYTDIVITNCYDSHLGYVGATIAPDLQLAEQRCLVWNSVDPVARRAGSGPFQVTMQVTDSLGGAENVLSDLNLSALDSSQAMVTPGPYELSTLVAIPSLHIQLDGPSFTHAGESIVYTVVYSNNGTIDAQPVTITLDYGNYLTFESATLQGSPINPQPGGGDNVFVDADALPMDGTPRTLAVQVAVAAPLPHDLAQIDNSASVQSDASLAVTADETVVLMRPQFTTFKKTGPAVAPPNVGSLMAYQFHLVNTGDYTATNCILADAWDSSLNFSTSGNWVNHGTYATLDVVPYELGPGDQAPVDILYVTIANVQDKYTNVAQLSCDQTLAITTIKDTWAASIATTKTASAASAFPGRVLTYTIDYTNTGGTVIDAVITDALPLGFSYQGQDSGVASASACIAGWQFQGVTSQDAAWVCNTLSEGATGQLQIWGLVTTDPAYEGTYLVNETASLYLDTVRPIEEPLRTRIERPWLGISKSANGNNPVSPGDYLTYTLVYSNYGSAPAYDVIISDQLPAQVTFVNCDPGCIYYSDLVTWNSSTAPVLSTVPTDALASVDLVVQVNAGTEGQTIVNDAYAIQARLLYDPVFGPAVETSILPSSHATPVEHVSIGGPTMGAINTLYTFTATVSPLTATQPITFAWQASGVSPVTHTVNHWSDAVGFTWSTTGTQTITVTASNVKGEATDVHAVVVNAPSPCPYPLGDVSINGPTGGYTDTLYTFNGVINPPNATEPLTYTWSPPPISGQGTVSAAYQWATPGDYTLTLAAENCGGVVSATHLINVSSDDDDYEPNDACTQARPILTDGSVQSHTFYTPGDADWVTFQAISGTAYLIEAHIPLESLADVVLELHDACGSLPVDNQDYSFSPDVRLKFQAPSDGPLYLRLSNHNPSLGGPDVSYELSVRALADTATPGALVLVAGRLRAQDTLQGNIHHVTDEVYRLFLSHGYTPGRIYYLATDLNLDPDGDGTPDVDGLPSQANLELAITQWALDKVGPDRAFTLYLMDHGGLDVFYLNGRGETVSPGEIDGWLDTLEALAPGVNVNVIAEACHSGSFIDELAPSVSQPGRVLIASTGAYAVAYASQDGAVFSDAFTAALEQGMSLYGSFQQGRSTAQIAHPDQTPWLDDDGDGVPNEGEDGQAAQQRGFAYVGTFPEDIKWPPYIVWAQVRDLQDGQGVIEAEVQDDLGVLSVWAVVYPPSYTPPDPDETEELVQEDLTTLTLLDSDGDDVYSAKYVSFDETGVYRAVVYAVDQEGFDGRPRDLQVRTGWPLYLPVVLRQ